MIFLTGCWAACPSFCLAGGGPESVLLVVNWEDASSKLIANHYVALRGIPARNVLYLANIPDQNKITVKEFQDLILRPIFEYIRDAKIEAQIDCIVYSSGFPTAIDTTTHQKIFLKRLEEREGPNSKQLIPVFSPTASITSLTYFAAAVLANEPGYMGLEANYYYRRPARLIHEVPFILEEQEKYDQARDDISGDKLDEGITALEALASKHPAQIAVSYSLAQAFARKGDATKATEWLTRAIRTGWCYRKHTQDDDAFAKIKADPLFKGIVDRMPDIPFEYAPTFGFSTRISWAANGSVNGNPNSVANFILCTMLTVNSKFGISERDSLDYLKRSVAADYSKPKGKFYFCDTSDVRSKTRQPAFASVMAQLKALGADVVLSHDTMPHNGLAVGATIGVGMFDWTKSKTTIVPGAIVENLTSLGADYSRDAHTRATELLKHGAAGSSGTVVEPFAIQQKFPHPMIHVHYRRGCSLAEAFYQSVSGPFQLLIVGDALCQPWAVRPELKATGLEPMQKVSGEVQLILTTPEGSKIDFIEIYLDGKLTNRKTQLEEIKFDSKTLPDGYHELRLVPIANTPIQTKGNVTIPFLVQNESGSITLSTKKKSFAENETIKISLESNLGKNV
ncbi:MAG: hypothetical protein ABL888_17555, partial [Pirellulaceae bacterium]